jgi:hypothetical protein
MRQQRGMNRRKLAFELGLQVIKNHAAGHGLPAAAPPLLEIDSAALLHD